MSNGGIGNGKCWEFQNQSRFSSASLRRSSNSAQYGYISRQPSQPAGVSTENGLGKSAIASGLRRNFGPGLASESRGWQGRSERGALEKCASERGRSQAKACSRQTGS